MGDGSDRSLTLRPLRRRDADGLDRLYRSLSPRDRYQRFFTEGPPPPSTVERYVGLVIGSGSGTVAVTDDGTIVGEAGWIGLPGGDGEFGITVAQDWRGLGGVLFDSIAAEAARAGVAALEADVLADNRAMLGLAAARGYAIVPTAERRVVRIVVGTATTVPPWPAGTPSPRLLVETPSTHWRLAPAAAEAGFHILSCRGPSSFRHGRCPALHGRPCPLVEGSDVVVVALPADDPGRGALAPIHRFCHARVPVLLQEAPGEGRPAWLPDGLPTLAADATPDRLVAALRAAVAPGGTGAGRDDRPPVISSPVQRPGTRVRLAGG